MQYAYQLKSRFSLRILPLGDAAKIIEEPKIRGRESENYREVVHIIDNS